MPASSESLKVGNHPVTWSGWAPWPENYWPWPTSHPHYTSLVHAGLTGTYSNSSMLSRNHRDAPFSSVVTSYVNRHRISIFRQALKILDSAISILGFILTPPITNTRQFKWKPKTRI